MVSPLTAQPYTTGADRGGHPWLPIFGGILAVVCGLVAIIMPQLTNLVAPLFIGSLLAVVGVLGTLSAVTLRGVVQMGAILLAGVSALAVGLFLFFVAPATSATVIATLAIYLLADGACKIYHTTKTPSKGGHRLATIGGGLSVGFAILLALAWPTAPLWMLGLLVGCALISYGLVLINAVLTVEERTTPRSRA